MERSIGVVVPAFRPDVGVLSTYVRRIDEALGPDEILLALVTLRTEGTHGTGLIDDIDGLFGVEPSPGTVYPRLHDLDAEGPLARHDLVRTKQYVVDDDPAARERLESAMHQHLAVGLFLAAALDTV